MKTQEYSPTTILELIKNFVDGENEKEDMLYLDNEIKRFIEQGQDINQPDDESKIPLHHANHWKTAKALLSNGANLNIIDYEDRTPLFYHANDLEIVRLLVENKADVNIKDYINTTPLFYTNNNDIFNFLLENKADINVKNDNMDLFLNACSKNYFEIVKTLITKYTLYFDVNEHIQSKSGIHLTDDISIINFLLENKADINKLQGKTESFLHSAVNNLEKLEILLKNGALIDLHDREFRTALFHAKDPKIIQTLIDNKADVNRTDDFLASPIYYATNKEAFNLFLKNGADLSIRFGIFLNACEKGYKEIIDILISEHNYNPVTEVDLFGNTSLHYAIRGGQIDIINLLIKLKCDAHIKNYEGQSALFHAKKNDVVKLLLTEKFNINEKDNNGLSLLHVVNQGIKNLKYTTKFLTFLVENKADVKMQDNNGNTPFHYLADSNPLIIQLYVKEGLDVNIKNNLGHTAFHYMEKTSKFFYIFSKVFKEKGLIEPLITVIKPIGIKENILHRMHINTDVKQDKENLLTTIGNAIDKLLSNLAILTILDNASVCIKNEIVLWSYPHKTLGGSFDHSSKNIDIYNSGNKIHFLMNTIVHEITHFVMNDYFINSSKPYFNFEETLKMKELTEIAEFCKKEYPEIFVGLAGDSYTTDQYPAELIAYFMGGLAGHIIENKEFSLKNSNLLDAMYSIMLQLEEKITINDLMYFPTGFEENNGINISGFIEEN